MKVTDEKPYNVGDFITCIDKNAEQFAPRGKVLWKNEVELEWVESWNCWLYRVSSICRIGAGHFRKVTEDEVRLEVIMPKMQNGDFVEMIGIGVPSFVESDDTLILGAELLKELAIRFHGEFDRYSEFEFRWRLKEVPMSERSAPLSYVYNMRERIHSFVDGYCIARMKR